MMTGRYVVGLCGVLFAASCSEPADVDFAAIRALGRNCPVYKCPPAERAESAARQASLRSGATCGPTGAVLGARAFHELDTNVNNAVVGLRITAVEDAMKQRLTLIIDGDELTAQDSTGAIRRGSELIGTHVFLVEEDGKLPPPPEYYLLLTGVGMTPFRVGGGSAHTYTFHYRRLGDGTGEQPLCTPPKNALAWQDREGQDLAGTAFVFGGDHYDDRAKTVELTADTRFNIACAGTEFATMHLNRHTTAGSDTGHNTTREQRQAMFKMLYADYCGTGRSFTFEDHPIEYDNTKHWFTKPAASSSYEAVWSEHGAVCLDEPRLTGAVDDIVNDIGAECKLPPPCTAFKDFNAGDWSRLGDVLSTNGNYDRACPLPGPVNVP